MLARVFRIVSLPRILVVAYFHCFSSVLPFAILQELTQLSCCSLIEYFGTISEHARPWGRGGQVSHSWGRQDGFQTQRKCMY